MTEFLFFIIGFIVGVFVMALMNAASYNDRDRNG